MKETLILIYLIAYPIYFAVKVWAIYKDKNLRIRNNRTRLQYIKEIGDEALMSWRTVLWAYLMLWI